MHLLSDTSLSTFVSLCGLRPSPEYSVVFVFFSTPKQICNTIFYAKRKQVNLAYCTVTVGNMRMLVFAFGTVFNLDRIHLQDPLFKLS